MAFLKAGKIGRSLQMTNYFARRAQTRLSRWTPGGGQEHPALTVQHIPVPSLNLAYLAGYGT
ncbi:hypothetical protein PBS_22140 [Paraburkholderia sp. 2C]